MEGIDADWRKSSYSGTNGGQCVEVGTWRKSTHSASNGGACVEIGSGATNVLIRDTTDRAGAVLAIPAASWHAFLAGIQA